MKKNKIELLAVTPQRYDNVTHSFKTTVIFESDRKLTDKEIRIINKKVTSSIAHIDWEKELSTHETKSK